MSVHYKIDPKKSESISAESISRWNDLCAELEVAGERPRQIRAEMKQIASEVLVHVLREGEWTTGTFGRGVLRPKDKDAERALVQVLAAAHTFGYSLNEVRYTLPSGSVLGCYEHDGEVTLTVDWVPGDLEMEGVRKDVETMNLNIDLVPLYRRQLESCLGYAERDRDAAQRKVDHLTDKLQALDTRD